MVTFPALFVSHGAPTLLIDGQPARGFLSRLGRDLGRPQAILSVTAHWTTAAPALSAAEFPETIHDFGGFPDELYRIRYPAPGDPALARRAADLLGSAGIEAGLDGARGFDHGTWVPLALAYPSADVPVVQLSVQPGLSPAHHFRVGQALRPLRDEGVLVLASGAATHDLRAYFTAAASDEPAWVADFAEWIAARVEAGDAEALQGYRAAAPWAARNHPTDEHLLPLFVAMGAGTPGRPGRRLHASTDGGVLRMDAYRFD